TTYRRAAVDPGRCRFRCRSRPMVVTAGLSGNTSSVDATRLTDESGAAPPKPAVTSCDELQAVFVTWPACVFRQLEILLGRLPAFAVLRALLHLGRGVLHQREDILCVLLGAEPAVGLSGMTGDQPVPVQCEHLLDELLGLEGIDIDEAATRKCSYGDGIDDENDLFLWQSHDQVRVGMIEAKVLQFERGTAESDRPAIVVDHLVRKRGIVVVEHGKAFLRPLVRDNGCAGIFEGLAAGDVVVVVMAVDQE